MAWCALTEQPLPAARPVLTVMSSAIASGTLTAETSAPADFACTTTTITAATTPIPEGTSPLPHQPPAQAVPR